MTEREMKAEREIKIEEPFKEPADDDKQRIVKGERWCGKRHRWKETEGVFLVTTANAVLPVDRDHSVNTDS